jgi:hypothetical protein
VDKPPGFVHENATIIAGNDTEAGVTVLFVLKSDGAVVYSFPMGFGQGKILTEAEIELFLNATEESDMLAAIRTAWNKRRSQ